MERFVARPALSLEVAVRAGAAHIRDAQAVVVSYDPAVADDHDGPGAVEQPDIRRCPFLQSGGRSLVALGFHQYPGVRRFQPAPDPRNAVADYRDVYILAASLNTRVLEQKVVDAGVRRALLGGFGSTLENHLAGANGHHRFQP